MEKKGYDRRIQRGMQQGMRQGLLEGIELSVSIKFGDDGLKLMPAIFLIEDIARLEAIKDALKTVHSSDEFQACIEA